MLHGVGCINCVPAQTWDLTFLTKWIQIHAEDAAAMGKPLIVEEFGKQVSPSQMHSRCAAPMSHDHIWDYVALTA